MIAGGPAESAGLQGGDLIVSLAGQAIANIYDYTYALDILKVGEPAEVTYVRGGERITAELIPGSARVAPVARREAYSGSPWAPSFRAQMRLRVRMYITSS